MGNGRHFSLWVLLTIAGVSALAVAAAMAASATSITLPASAPASTPAPATAPAAAAATDAKPGPIKTQIVPAVGGYALLRDGKPFFIMGGGGDASKPKLVEAGGNSYRTWGPPDVKSLDEAHKLGLAVTVGLWLGGDGGFNYSNSGAVARQLEDCKKVIERLKDHPAVLIWGIGNEMEGPGKPGDNPALWKAIDDIAAAAKKIDPNHPTMTVIAEIGGARVPSIHRYCPHIDIVGINSYGSVTSIGMRYRMNGGTKPFVITEYGPPGTWELNKMGGAFGAMAPSGQTGAQAPPPPEPTSTAKGEYYRNGWLQGIAGNKGLCLGGYAFTWGAKWEATATWYGMFLSDGSKLEAVDVMTELWSRKPPANRCPRITGIRLVGSHSPAPGEIIQAGVTATDPENDPLTYKWELHKEGGQSKEIAEAIKRTEKGAVEIEMPKATGVYRLYIYVHDDKGGAATGNIPLTVL